jgi:hypothetical protein
MKNFLLWFLPVLSIGTITLNVIIFNRININQYVCIPSACTVIGNGTTRCTDDCNGGKSYLIVWVIALIVTVLTAYWVYLLKQRKTSVDVSN